MSLEQNQLKTQESSSKEAGKQHESFVDNLLHSAAYTFAQQPITAVTQLVDAVADTHLSANVQFMQAPESAKFGSSNWVAQTVGGAVGMLPWLVGIGKVTKMGLGGVGTDEAAGL